MPVKLGVLPEEAETTACFLERMDRLFNAFNSGSLASNQSMGHGMSTTSGHKEFLIETLSWFENIQSLASRPLPCIMGWRMNIRALLALFDDLTNDCGIQCLFTDRLNQDCVENLFSVLRGKVGNVHNPSAQSFRHALTQVMVDSLFVHSFRSNCANNNDHMLLILTGVTNNGENMQDENEERIETDPPCQHEERASNVLGIEDRLDAEDWDNLDMDSVFNDVDMTHTESTSSSHCDIVDMTYVLAVSTPLPPKKDEFLRKSENAVLTYIAGFVAKRILPKSCDDCQPLLKGVPTGAESEMLLEHKQYSDLRGHGDLEKIYAENIDDLLPAKNIMATLVALLKQKMKGSVLVCPSGICDLTGNICRLYTNIRFHFTLRKITASFSQKTLKRNRKLMNITHK